MCGLVLCCVQFNMRTYKVHVHVKGQFKSIELVYSALNPWILFTHNLHKYNGTVSSNPLLPPYLLLHWVHAAFTVVAIMRLNRFSCITGNIYENSKILLANTAPINEFNFCTSIQLFCKIYGTYIIWSLISVKAIDMIGDARKKFWHLIWMYFKMENY